MLLGHSVLGRAIIFVFCVFLSACSITDRWVYEDSEGVVGEQFFKSIKRKKTTKSWVVKNLGEPFAVNHGERGEEVYSYNFKRTHYRSASFFVLFRYDGSERDVEHFHVVFCEDIVRKAWWDSLPEVQTSRLGYGARCPKKKKAKEKKSSEKISVSTPQALKQASSSLML